MKNKRKERKEREGKKVKVKVKVWGDKKREIEIRRGFWLAIVLWTLSEGLNLIKVQIHQNGLVMTPLLWA